MKQIKHHQQEQQQQCLLLSNSSKDEIEIADILLDLYNLVTQNQFCSLVWGSKKRRSNRRGYIDSSSSLQESSKLNECEIDKHKVKVEVNSPATPLSFSPSESDDKSKPSRKRKTREELMGTIKQLSQCGELLRGEVETVRNYYNNQKAYNLKLKAMKEQVTRMLNIQGSSVNSNHGMEPNHQQPFIMDQVALGSKGFHRFQYPLGQLQQAQQLYSNGLGRMNHVGLRSGPMGLPDLNVTVDGTFTMDPFNIDRMKVERKAQYTEARRRRMIKRIEVKNSSGFIRPQRRR